MKTLVLAAVVALLCMQALHANPTPEGVSEKSESHHEYSYTSKGGTEGDDDGGEATKTTTTTTEDGKTVVTTSKTTEGTKVYTLESSSDDLSSGGSTTSNYEWSEGSQSKGSETKGSETKGSETKGSESEWSGSGKITVGGDDKCDGKNGPCGGEHTAYTFDLDAADMEFFDDDLEGEYTSENKTVHHIRDSKCEDELEIVNGENDELTEELIRANEDIKRLSDEKRWGLKQLEKCRDEVNCKTSDFETISSENKLIRKKYEKLSAEFGKLRTESMTLYAEYQKLQGRANHLEIELKKATEINVQLTITVKEYTTTITSLRTTVNEITLKNSKCSSESEEWRVKFEFESTKVTKYELTIKNLEINVADWKSKNDKLTDDLSTCRTKNTANDNEINDLKDELNDVKSKLSTCNTDLATTVASLKLVTNEFNEDELRDQEELSKRLRIQFELDECIARRDEFEVNYKSEKDNYASCKIEIVTIREESEKKSKKCEEDIININISFQARIDTCQNDLQSEKDNYSKVLLKITVLENKITVLESDLTISIKVSEEWQQKNQYCEDNSVNLNKKISTLELSIINVNVQLSTCITNNDEIQTELSTCNAKLGDCSDDLTDAQKKNTDNEATIEGLQSDVLELQDDNKSCKSHLSQLRCDTNQLLAIVDEAEKNTLQALLGIQGIVTNSKNAVDKFVGSKNIVCTSCSSDKPCIAP